MALSSRENYRLGGAHDSRMISSDSKMTLLALLVFFAMTVWMYRAASSPILKMGCFMVVMATEL
jgi:hypothetical protein